MIWFYAFLGIALLYLGYRFKRSVDSRPDPTKEEIIRTITQFLDGTCGPHDWDHFISIPLNDPELEQIRKDCEDTEYKYPRKNKNEWCSEEGLEELRSIAEKLKAEA